MELSKAWLKFCNIVPLCTIGLSILLQFVPEDNPLYDIILVLALFPYLFLVYFLLPAILMPDTYKKRSFYLAYFVMTALSVGIAPVAIYYLRLITKSITAADSEGEHL